MKTVMHYKLCLLALAILSLGACSYQETYSPYGEPSYSSEYYYTDNAYDNQYAAYYYDDMYYDDWLTPWWFNPTPHSYHIGYGVLLGYPSYDPWYGHTAWYGWHTPLYPYYNSYYGDHYYGYNNHNSSRYNPVRRSGYQRRTNVNNEVLRISRNRDRTYSTRTHNRPSKNNDNSTHYRTRSQNRSETVVRSSRRDRGITLPSTRAGSNTRTSQRSTVSSELSRVTRRSRVPASTPVNQRASYAKPQRTYNAPDRVTIQSDTRRSRSRQNQASHVTRRQENNNQQRVPQQNTKPPANVQRSRSSGSVAKPSSSRTRQTPERSKPVSKPSRSNGDRAKPASRERERRLPVLRQRSH